AAVKLGIPIAHVEARLRSFNMAMPEEINRIVTDRISSLLFCPSQTAVDNLKKEGLAEHKLHVVGDVMYDSIVYFKSTANPSAQIRSLTTNLGQFALATIHRAENTDDLVRLNSIFGSLRKLAEKYSVVLPLHPRTRNIIDKNSIQ